MAFIEAHNISKIFGSQPKKMLQHVNQGMSKAVLQEKHQHVLGLHDINLAIEQGEIFVIMGLSGSGKSTLIRHFNRLVDPTAGQIIVDGEDITALSIPKLRDFRQKTMSMVFQHFGLMPHRTILDNASYAPMIQGVDKAAALTKGREWLALVGLSEYESYYPSQLSGGQQQRVGLARALAADTEIILMDEAFSALDPLIRSNMQEQLLALQEKLHKTIIFITHDLSEALRIGTRIAILKDGKIAQIGTPEDILMQPADDYVTDFVKDVNRASVLNVEAVMTCPRLYFENESLSEALVAMKDNALHWGWVLTGERYEGLVTAKDVEKALQQQPDVSLSDIAEKPQSVAVKDSIEALIPAAIGNVYPVPVVDDDGQLAGVVQPEQVTDLLKQESRAS